MDPGGGAEIAKGRAPIVGLLAGTKDGAGGWIGGADAPIGGAKPGGGETPGGRNGGGENGIPGKGGTPPMPGGGIMPGGIGGIGIGGNPGGTMPGGLSNCGLMEYSDGKRNDLQHGHTRHRRERRSTWKSRRRDEMRRRTWGIHRWDSRIAGRRG